MSVSQAANATALQRYYQLHARIYDLTRWSFLFGRTEIINWVEEIIQPQTILEVGCGTGTNLLTLAKRFPHAKISGIDLSKDMLSIARKKLQQENHEHINLIEKRYDTPLLDQSGERATFDLVLFSYALTMFNPGWEIAIKTAREQLSENGIIAIVDFHDSRFDSFRRWMRVNHVRIEGHLRPFLDKQLAPIIDQTHSAYAGLWKYLLYIGKK